MARTSLPPTEGAPARLLGSGGAMRTRFESRHRPVDGNALRAAVLGANDGLVSNFCLVMGVAGASAGSEPVVIAGVAGLLAGSLSMALGEWLSVQSARELYANKLAIEGGASDASPEREEEELRVVYERLGIDPEELGGSAWTAAIMSFVLFGIGAAVPLAPFLMGSGIGAVLASAALSAGALFALGAAITTMTGRPPLLAGLRQLAFGLAAAAITFAIGALMGITVG